MQQKVFEAAETHGASQDAWCIRLLAYSRLRASSHLAPFDHRDIELDMDSYLGEAAAFAMAGSIVAVTEVEV